jgi:hypothetical protein
MTTDLAARAKFRRYWSFLSPGIILIRWISLAPLKAEAERRALVTRDVFERRHENTGDKDAVGS